jgi:molybdate/tungstate transport system substrate-binding protein
MGRGKYYLLILLIISITLLIAYMTLTSVPEVPSGKTPEKLTSVPESSAPSGKTPEKLKIFLAGSLKIPVERITELYRKINPNLDFQLEASGSVEAIKKVTELGKYADLILVADYGLIPQLMADHADWYVVFATNRLVIAYTKSSKYASEINENNWHRILMRDGVKFGFSDPNRDPCGYRTVISFLLASNLSGSPLASELLSGTNIRVSGMEAWVPDPIQGSEKVVIRPKSVELLALLESGVLDYAFEYESVAIQHNLSYVRLPDEINLGNPELKDFYSRAKVHLGSGEVIEGDAIAYGLTIPKVAARNDEALKFTKFLLTEGLNTFEELGQRVVRPPLAYGKVPEELKGIVKEVGG